MDDPDTKLVTEIKKRNPQAYERLIQTYTKPIYYLAYNILQGTGASKEDIEECASDVLLEAWLKIKEYDGGKASLKTWLLMLTKYQALTYRRKLKEDAENVLSIDDCEVESPYAVEKQVIDRETQEKVISVIHGFNAVDREIFIRRYFYNEQISELMDSLNLSRSAIDNRLLRGRKMIKGALSYE